MLGFTGVDSADIVNRQRGSMADTRERWPFLTPSDASIIKNERQLVTMVGDRCSRPQQDAEADVQDGRHGVLAEGKGPDFQQETPLFFNELGVNSIQIGVAAFRCMGVMPPHDHPHVYLNMGEQTDLLCPYCSTEYVLNPALRWNQTNPVHCCAVSHSTA